MYDNINSRYTYKNSNVVINKLNITDEKEFEKCQTKMVELKLKIISKECNFGKYDENRLKTIHKFLFEEIFDFAGIYRLENIAKDNFRFAEFSYISENITKILQDIDIEKYSKLSFDLLIAKISYILTELNVIHPFREGNGRTIRELVREILNDLGYYIDWSKIEYKDIVKVSKIAVIDDTKQQELLRKYIKLK